VAIQVANTEWPKWESVMAADPLDEETRAKVEGSARNAPLTRPRPGHADLAGMQKYAFDEARPVLERASARETAARVALGRVATNFLQQAVGATVVSTVIVLALALGIALNLRLRGGRLASVFAGLAVVPLFIPVVIASWAILTFYSGDGFVRTVFALVGLTGPTWGYTTVAVVIGSVWTSLPFATLMAISGVQSIPDAMIEAAKDAGASSFAIVTRILVPLSAIPLVIAATFTAIGVLGSFTVPYFTGPNAPSMLGVDISKYFQAFNHPQQAIVMAVVVFVLASGIAFFYVWANFRSAKKEGRV
jgi:ABC-type spermidine/putrescine transport system permease subunit I